VASASSAARVGSSSQKFIHHELILLLVCTRLELICICGIRCERIRVLIGNDSLVSDYGTACAKLAEYRILDYHMPSCIVEVDETVEIVGKLVKSNFL
jgi:hypothetical protein